MILPQN